MARRVFYVSRLWQRLATDGGNIMKRCSLILVPALGGLVMLASCGSQFDRCVEDRQSQYKKDHPEANYAELPDSRELFQKQCREEVGE